MTPITKLIIKRLLPTVVGAIILVLAGLWLYGYVGVKAGWIGPTKIPNLNAVSHSGAEAAGGITACRRRRTRRSVCCAHPGPGWCKTRPD